MDEQLVKGVVRILDADGGTAGTGFLLTADGLIATCAHVLGGRDSADVTFFDSTEPRLARLEPDCLRPAEAEDVAVLRLETSPPEGVAPFRLGASTQALGHAVRSFGYPAATQSAGMWGSARIVGTTKQAGYPVLQLEAGSDITRGFSGAPVIDLATRCAIGMITAITATDAYGRQSEVVFATPAETLQQIVPSLELAVVPAGSRFLEGLEGDPLPLLRKRAARQSNLWLRENTGSGRYLPQVFCARPAMLAAITGFLAGERAGFVLTGESGIGKTMLLCHLIEQWQRDGELVLAYHAQGLQIEQPLEERVLLDMHVSSDFVALVDVLKAAERRLILVLDGVNEHEAAPRLLQQISGFIQRYAPSQDAESDPALKVLLSFRNSFLDALLDALPAPERDEARLFPDFAFEQRATENDEQRYRFELGPMALREIESAYEAYRHCASPDAPPRFCPTTPFAQIDAGWHAALANPFYLRLLVETYHGRSIPAKPWHGQVMRSFCELKIWGSERDAHRYAVRAALVDQLVGQMRGRQLAALRKDALPALSPQWAHALSEEAGGASPYRQLIEDGVLMETIVRETLGRAPRTHVLVRFAFDTLFEYLLGDDILREAGGWEGLSGAGLGAEIARSQDFPYLAGAVEHLVLEAIDACNFLPLVELFGALDPGVHEEVYEALSPKFTAVELPSGTGLIYDRTGSPELFARLKETRFLERLVWKLFEWGDPVSAPLSTIAGTTRGRERPSCWHRHFKRLFEAITVGADARAAFNLALSVGGRAGQLKDDQLSPFCSQLAWRLRTDRIEGGHPVADGRAAVLLVQAQALADTRDLDGAIDMALRARKRLEDLAQGTQALNRELAECHVHLASLNGWAGHLAETIVHSRSAAQLLRDLPRLGAFEKQLLSDALRFEREARTQQDAGADVEALLVERIGLMRELIESDGLDTYRQHLSDDLIDLSEIDADRGDLQSALDRVVEAVALCRPAQSEDEDENEDADEDENDADTGDAQLLDRLPRALICEGVARLRLDEIDRAYEAFGEAIEICARPAGAGNEDAIAMGLRGLQYRCRLCASVERWDLVAADVVAAFQWWFKACDDGTPSKAVIQAFGDLLTRLGRLPESQLASVFEALGTDNAAVVRDFLADVQRKSDKAGTDRPDR